MPKCADIAEKLKALHSSQISFIAGTSIPCSTMVESEKTLHHMEYLCHSVMSILCRRLEDIERGTKFRIDNWLKHDQHGGGITCVLENGSVFDKVYINLYVMTLPISEASKRCIPENAPDLSGHTSFKAVALGAVIHPKNPHIPTLRLNFRYREMDSKDASHPVMYWFGGVTDLVPYILHKDDVISFHKCLKDVCDKFDGNYYPKFKKLADEYYYLPHRKEHCGVGGIFFDDLVGDPSRLLDFQTECLNAILLTYIPILQRTMNLPATKEEIDWMHIRRGRLVEFELLYDRGPKIGLNLPGARIESFLATLPSYVRWSYCTDHHPESPQGILMNYIRNPVDWVQ